MPDKKESKAEPNPEENILSKRVDMIMGETYADGVTPIPRKPLEPNPPAIDIFKDPSTAPAVSDTLLKQIGADEKVETAKPAEVATATPSEAENSQEQTPASDDEIEIDNPETEKAVDDIAVNESDAILEAEDRATQKTDNQKSDQKQSKFKKLLRNKWLWIGLGLIALVIFAVPYTRYTVLGLFIKQTVTVVVTDSKTNTGVSNTAVSLSGAISKTDANGKAKLVVPIGDTTLTVKKQYYKDYTAKYFVSFKSGQIVKVSLVATGRQVPITVINKISGKPLSGAQIKVLDTTAKTDSKGQARIVLPTKTTTESATVSLTGFNTAKATITVTDQAVPTNTVSLTPSGHIYFLSNLSGKIDVVKSNLDGSDRSTVLAGTGKENPNSTVLLASRDWRFLVLKAQRDTPQPSLYLIDTSTDKLTNFDSGDADFSMIGWYEHNFIYDVVRNTVPNSQSGHESLKSYMADSLKLSLLDQNMAEGSATAYAYQGFYNYYLAGGLVVYNTQWYTYNAGGGGFDLGNKTDTIRGIKPTGQNKKDYQTFPAAGVGYIQAALYEPQSIYYGVYNYNDNKSTYYKYQDQSVTSQTNLDQATFNRSYPTYLLSPSGLQTFWTELRDGKNSLFLGDSNAQNAKQIASLSDYSPYGWFTENYVLVSKNNSQLYVMPAATLGTQQPIKITDYFKPSQTLNGYGYGYGGL